MALNTRSSEHHFDVFLSYSRKDEEFAKRLEEALENYRLPKDVPTRLVSKNRLNVFRDKRDLVPTDGDYWKTIEGYLARSANLLVVCSPNAARSEYVNHEIETFLRFHEAKRVIPILLWGRPNNEAGAAPEEQAFPPALCDALAMPLAVEFSEYPQARGRVDRGRYHDSWYTLLAKLFGAERAEIERQDARRQARRRAIFAAVSLAIIALLSVALVVTLASRQEVVRQRDHARRLLYASDMNLAQRAFETGNVGLGRKLLEGYQPANAADQEDLRGFEWHYLWRLDNEQLAAFDDTDDIVFSPDGTVLATVSPDAVTIRDAASRRETARFPLPARQTSERPPSIAFSADGKTLAYGDGDRMLLLDLRAGSWRTLPPPGFAPRPGETPERAEFLATFWNDAKGGPPRFAPDGKWLAVSYGCGLVAVYDAASLQLRARLGDGPAASSCTDFAIFSPDSRTLAYGNLANVKLWDVVADRDLGEPEMDESMPDSVSQVEAVAFSPDSKLLAIGDRSKQLVLWSLSTRKVLARLRGHDGWITALAFSHDGRIIYSGGQDQTVRLWDFSSYNGRDALDGEKIKTFAMIRRHIGSIRRIVCAPAGNITAMLSADRTAKLWSETAGREFDTIADVVGVSASASLFARTTNETDRTFTTLFALGEDAPARLWNANGSVNPTLSPDGKILATERSSGDLSLITLWDVASRRELATLRAQTSMRAPGFSPDGALFAAIGPDGKSLLLWDTVERKELPPIQNDAELKDFLLSPGGKVIVTIDKDRPRLKSWRGAPRSLSATFERKPKRPLPARGGEDVEPALLLAISPDGARLALSDSETIELWETDSANEPIPLGKLAGGASVLAASPDSRFLAAGDESGEVKLWDVASRAELVAFRGHKENVTTLAFSPDGRSLASGGGDGAVKLYGLASLRELITLTHPPSPTSEIHAAQGGEDVIVKLFFAPEGRALLTLSGNGLLRIWRGPK
ncbi:MAG: TIR domain-containing protein [Blastocatellia bacterium]|nr:TIR domain-containing protein [Blastocatellia bacterium]